MTTVNTEPVQAPKLDPRLVEMAWKTGTLAWKLRNYQLPVYDAFWGWIHDPDCLSGCANISRQFGKSYSMNLVVDEFCRRVPRAQVRFAAPSGLMLRNITLPIMRQLLADCPKDLRPRWRRNDHFWEYPNGSEFHIAGANEGHADDLRGSASHLSGVDEAGFVDDLKYLIDGVLMPQTLTTGGTLLVSSTPPESPVHPYVEYATDCKDRGHYIHRDIHATNQPKHVIDQYAKQAGGYASTTWKREYLAQFVVDESLAIIPEWDNKYVEAVERCGLWRFWHKYEAMDLGVRDLTVCLFGYYDFRKARLVIEDELVINGPQLTTKLLAEKIREKEKALWPQPNGEAPSIYRRVSDNNNPLLMNDLAALHSLPFFGTSKDELTAMVNKVRLWAKAGRVIVHPRCTNLIDCLRAGVWKSAAHIGRDFGRGGARLGHFDAMAALTYAVRNCDEHSNPIPATYGWNLDPHKTFIPEKMFDTSSDVAKVLRERFGVLRKRK